MDLYRGITSGQLTDFNDVNEAVGNGISVKDRNSLKSIFDDLHKDDTKLEADLKSRFTSLCATTISKSNKALNILDNEGEKRAKQFLQEFTIENNEKRDR